MSLRPALPALLLALSLPAAAQQTPSAPDPTLVIGDPAGAPLSGATLEEEAARVSSLLRCPSCQGLSVQDSPTEISQQMRAQVHDLLSRGYTEEQVLAYFERSYGEFVRLEPPLRGINWLVWLAPLAALAAGGWVVARALGGGAAAASAPAAEEPPAPADPGPARGALPDDAELAAYVRRVREAAYGWPGGEPPEGA